MISIKHTLSTIVAGTLMMASLGAFAIDSTEKTMYKRSQVAHWSSADQNHPTILWQILDKNSGSRIHVFVDDHDPALGDPRSDVTLSGCSGQNNIVIKAGTNIECVVHSSAPLIATSVDNQEALGTVEFLAISQ